MGQETATGVLPSKKASCPNGAQKEIPSQTDLGLSISQFVFKNIQFKDKMTKYKSV